MLPIQAMRLRKPAPAITDAIYMQFDAGNGTSTFTDGGTAGTTWTRSGAGVVTTTAVILDGVSSLLIPSGGTDYLEAATSAASRLPASANFSIKFTAQCAGWLAPGGGGCYLLSIQDSGATGAGTQFAIATNASGLFGFAYSDGSTRSVTPFIGAAPNGSPVVFEFSRSGTTLTLTANGSTMAQVTGFSGNFPAATGTKWRIGKPEFGSTNGPQNPLYFDNFTLTR